MNIFVYQELLSIEARSPVNVFLRLRLGSSEEKHILIPINQNKIVNKDKFQVCFLSSFPGKLLVDFQEPG